MADQFSEKEYIIKDIICKLDANQLQAGERLPTESELAAQYGISKTNVHLAIQQLERLGFVRVVPRHAIYINPPEALSLEAIDALFKYLDTIPSRPVIEALLEMRRMMGTSLIKSLASNQRPEIIDQLHVLMDQLEAAVDTGDQETREKALLNLMSFLYRNAGNALFPVLVRSLNNSMTQAVHYISLYAEPHEMIRVYRSMERHAVAGDSDKAVQVWYAWNEKLTQIFLHGLYGDKP